MEVRLLPLWLSVIAFGILATIASASRSPSSLSSSDRLLRSPPSSSLSLSASSRLRSLLVHRRRHTRGTISFANLPGPPGRELPPEVIVLAKRNQSCHHKEIIQNITAPGCETKSMANRMCYGVCLSIHMPGTSANGDDRLELCTKCQPSGPRHFSSITLNCNGGKKKSFQVPIVERCNCLPCINSIG